MALLAITCIAIFPPWEGILAWLAPLPDSVEEQVEDAIDHGLVGIIVYVDQSGKAERFYSAGWKNRANQIPADPQSLFKIASISKLYIAAATAKLINSGRLSLDDKLADKLPELVGRIENADQITLRMMLQHRSGIPNFTDHDQFNWAAPGANSNENLELVLDEPADFEPDGRYRYSNTNYLLIGSILDNELGYIHQRFIDREILAPLGLTRTFGLLSQVDIEEVVSGYHDSFDEDLREIDYVTPGGSMIATAQDVGIFLRALNDGSLFNDDEQAIYSSIYEYEHTGWILGYQSIARYYENIDTVVIQFVNTTGSESIMVSNVIYGRIVQILN